MTGTLINYKTENGIFKDFIGLTKEALNFFNIQGWNIRQLHQVLNVNVLTPTIFISVVTANQSGAQYRSYRKADNVLTQTNNTKQEIKIRFSASCKRSIKDDATAFYGKDVLSLVTKYLQSPQGISSLAQLGYAQYRASNVTNQEFLDDSENIEFMPFFECEYLYTDSWSTATPEIDNFTIDIHKV